MIRIAVVDDQKNDLAYIKKGIEKQLDLRNIKYKLYLYIDASKLLQDNENDPFDVVFLDIDMPQLTGMDAAESINNISPKTIIVFVTNHDELVYKAYRFKAVGFVRKSYFDDEINEILDVVLTEIHKRNHILNISDNRSIIKIDLFNLLYVKSDDHYAEFYSKNSKQCIRQSLNDIEMKIEHFGFIRTHSRYLVNYRHIYSIEKTVVILSDGKTQIPISRNKITDVKEKVQMFSRSIE